MKEQQEIIQKICGKLKHQEVEKGTDWCVCKEIVACYKVFGELGILITYELLGWLKSKEVLIGVFTEDEVCSSCGDVPKQEDKNIGGNTYHLYICSCGGDVQPFLIPAFQYHHDSMGFTVEECLEYYGRFLG